MFILPSERTLKATLAQVSIRPGISNQLFNVLSRKIGRNKRDRICTIIFDEIQIQPHLDYLLHEDRVIGFEDDGTKRSGAVADDVAVFMLRASSIVSFYKHIVAEATAVGFNIIASVCDMGSNNIKAINDLLDYSKRLQTSEDDVVLDNVIRIPLRDNQYHEVIPLFDPSYLLKAFRNGLLERDCQFTWSRGQQQRIVAKWAYIERMDQIFDSVKQLSLQDVHGDSDDLARYAVGYIGGFLVHKLSLEKYECDICQRNLQHTAIQITITTGWWKCWNMIVKSTKG
ncbi:hypothetical protein TcasGA2_TC001843 [Tribolium castaneum]|uniref:Transposable element P transposase-like RNase H domain-containing protein n=1 Tax=Tribolium castaneum TaxID=7070 RepID=D7EJ76_TRICA|nr:hypothetical protein TcasGA2_TC001843 [Tribolium castaneum]